MACKRSILSQELKIWTLFLSMLIIRVNWGKSFPILGLSFLTLDNNLYDFS